MWAKTQTLMQSFHPTHLCQVLSNHMDLNSISELAHTGKVSLLAEKPQCFSYFLWIAFFSQRSDFRVCGHSLKPSNNGDVSAGNCCSPVLWLSLGISAGELWDSAQSAFKVLRGNLRHNPLLWEHWHKQNKTDMVAFYVSFKCASSSYPRKFKFKIISFS